MPSRINVIYLHPHFTLPGGAGNVILESARRLDQRRFRAYILCIRARGEYKKQYPHLTFLEIGGPMSSELLFWLCFPFMQIKIHSVLNRFPHKILFPHVFPANWWAFIYKLFHNNVPCIWFCHEPSAFIHSRPWMNAIEKTGLRFLAMWLNPLLKVIDILFVKKGADIIITNSRFSAGQVMKIYGARACGPFYPGVDVKRFKPAQSKRKYFLMVGRLTQFKRIQVALEAMARLKYKDYQLIIGGEGEAKGRLMALSRQFDLDKRVKFIGKVREKELPKLYAEAKLILHTSLNEPFGMVPLEALAAGTPVIGSNTGGLREVIIHNYNGILIDCLTPLSLKASIEDVLSDQARYEHLRQNARSSAIRFSWERHVRQLEKMICQAVTFRVVKKMN